MAERKVTTIPATINKFTAKPMDSKKNAELQDMHVSALTTKISKLATRHRLIIIPLTFKAEMIGILQDYIPMRE